MIGGRGGGGVFCPGGTASLADADQLADGGKPWGHTILWDRKLV